MISFKLDIKIASASSISIESEVGTIFIDLHWFVSLKIVVDSRKCWDEFIFFTEQVAYL